MAVGSTPTPIRYRPCKRVIFHSLRRALKLTRRPVHSKSPAEVPSLESTSTTRFRTSSSGLTLKHAPRIGQTCLGPKAYPESLSSVYGMSQKHLVYQPTIYRVNRLRGTQYADLVQIFSVWRAGYIPQMISFLVPNPNVVYDLLGRAGAKALICSPSFRPFLENSTTPSPVQFI